MSKMLEKTEPGLSTQFNYPANKKVIAPIPFNIRYKIQNVISKGLFTFMQDTCNKDV